MLSSLFFSPGEPSLKGGSLGLNLNLRFERLIPFLTDNRVGQKACESGAFQRVIASKI